VNVRFLYVLAGAMWALVLAPLAVVAAVGVGAGIAWIFLFGDDPWPPAAQSFILALGAVAGLLTAAAAIWIGNDRGKAAQVLRASNSRAGWRRAAALLAPPVFFALFIASSFWVRERNYRQVMTSAATQEAGFSDFVGATKRIAGVTVTTDSQGVVHATVRISGDRAGGYRLKWHVAPSTVDRPLISSDRALALGRQDYEVPIAFSIEDLRKQYQAVVLAGHGGALIDELFRLEVLLEPVPTEEERRRLPPGELHRLETSESPLQSRQTEAFPVRFTVTN